ncbi:MAG: VCBS repeat-containing protein [Planctomycetota bacterium]
MPTRYVIPSPDSKQHATQEPLSSCRSRSSVRGSSSQALLTAAVMAVVVAALPAQVMSTHQFLPAGTKHLPSSVGRASEVAWGDVDGDGDLDLVFAHYAQPRLYLNNGSGVFTDVTATHLPAGAGSEIALALGDVDGDGDLDLVFGGDYGNHRLFLNNGSGVFADATATHLPMVLSASAACVELGDIDGDGDLDLFIGTYQVSSPGTFGWQDHLYLNNGSGVFTDITSSHLPAAWLQTTSAALGDIDGDLDLDLVIGNNYGTVAPLTRLYLNNGSGFYADVTATHLPAVLNNANCVALGDVDGDDDLDLVVGRYGQNNLCLNDGTGVFTDVTATHLPAVLDLTKSIALADIDGDGDPDLVVGNRSNPGFQNRLHLNNGSGVFTDVTTTHLPAILNYTTSLALGDGDGDGDLDLVVGDEIQSRLYLNLHRQLHTPTLLRIGQPFPIDAYARNTPPGSLTLVVPYLSTTRISIPLPPLGTLGIVPEAPLGVATISPATGVASFSWNVPNLPAFIGLDVFAQALAHSSSGQDRLTNVTTDVLIQ